ncbi:unnamed protein product [Lupinus luteus]|uniref:TFIIS N-terminal domain-containing protein n=1 Tax=Lupinus luteus TaxID=3873 RepID=A0AAV1Y836_LUPLU
MDLDHDRSIVESASVDVWTLIDAALVVASIDYADEFKRRREGIVERIYTTMSSSPPCRNRVANNNAEIEKHVEEELNPRGGLFNDEKKKKNKNILEIKQQLEYTDQSEETLVELLHNLDDIDVTFQALKDTNIGRHVSKLGKHSSNDIRRLAKLLIRKWKGVVDEWVKLGEAVTNVMASDEESCQQKTPQNDHQQSLAFVCSTNPPNGNSGSDVELKSKSISYKVALPKSAAPAPLSLPTSTPQNRQRESKLDSERFAYARKRLQENYKEIANAKKQKMIQVMELHELPKPNNKNVFFAKKQQRLHGRYR